jgi:aerobic carbon-monoxide dehydrogenase medium subunit
VRLPPFALEEPESIADAIGVLAADGGSRLIAGGTALVPMLRLGLLKPERVVSLHRVSGLGTLEASDGMLDVGAMMTMAELLRSSLVRARCPLLAEAAGRVATPAIRASATIGGNLAYAEAASDPAPALLCLDATVSIAGPSGTRSVPLARFFTGFYETALAPGEIVTAVRVPASPPRARHGYVKFCPRSAEDKPLIGVAALLVFDASARCCDARIALGGAAPSAIRARHAESIVLNERLDERAVRAAADAAAGECDPLSDLMGSASYRREMVRVWVRRLLTRLTQRWTSATSEV